MRPQARANLVERPLMLLALRLPGPDTRALRLPTGLDAADGFLEFRAAVGGQLQTAGSDVLLDCSDITQVAPPVLGWLVSTAAELAIDGRRVVLIDAGPEFRLQLRTMGSASELLAISRSGRRVAPVK